MGNSRVIATLLGVVNQTSNWKGSNHEVSRTHVRHKYTIAANELQGTVDTLEIWLTTYTGVALPNVRVPSPGRVSVPLQYNALPTDGFHYLERRLLGEVLAKSVLLDSAKNHSIVDKERVV